MKWPGASSVFACLLLATPCSAAVHHYVFGVSPGLTYDVRQGLETVVTGLVPGPADEVTFTAPAASPIYIFPTGEAGDIIPPSAVSSLAITTATENTITLRWTAVGDDGLVGQAGSYDIRYATTPITSGTWASAIQVADEPAPGTAGTIESFTVTGLNGATLYYFALKVGDEAVNWSGMSNVASASTLVSPDTTPPSAIANLSVSSITATSVRLAWTAVGDDGATGTATTYDLRYATSPIDASNWAAATQATGESAPRSAGYAESFNVTGLTSSTTYYFAIKVADEVPNWSEISNVATATTPVLDVTPPATVGTLAITASTPHTVTLQWTSVGDDGEVGQASSYDVRYSRAPIDASNWSSATGVTGEPTPKASGQTETFTVSGLADGTQYSFALKVADEVPNLSGLSNVVSTETPIAPDTTPPARISNLAVRSSTATSVTLGWTATGDDGTVGQATSYDIRYSTSLVTAQNWANCAQAGGEPAPKSSGQSETFTVPDLQPQTRYYFGIRALDEVPNQGELSNVVNQKTQRLRDTTPPHGVNDLIALSIANREVVLGWTSPADDDSSQVTAYVGMMRAGDLDESTWETATPIPDLPTPAAPGARESITVTGLAPAASYAFAIRALDAEGNLAPLGSVARVTTTSAADTLPPTAVVDLSAEDATQTTMTLRWHAPADRIPADCVDTPEVDRYDIRFALVPLDGDGWDAGHSVPAPDPADPGVEQQTIVTGLTADTQYYFAMRARDARGQWSATSNLDVARTLPPDQLPDTTPPGAIRDLAVVSTEPTSVVIGWIAPGGDGDEGQADHYDVRRAAAPIDVDSWNDAAPILPAPACAAAGASESFRVTGLEPETTVHLALRAIDGAGNPGPISVSLMVVTPAPPDTTPPAAVVDLAGATIDTTTVILRWTAPADDSGPCAAYELRMSATAGDEAGWDAASWDAATPIDDLPVPGAPGARDSVRVSGLAPATRYAFALRSRDAAGNPSPVSNVAWADTDTLPGPSIDPPDQTPPGRVSDLSATPLSSTSIRLAWTAVGDDGDAGRAALYEIRRSSSAIDASSWDSAIPVSVDLLPGEPGSSQMIAVTGLASDADHHFAIRVSDEAGNTSEVSSDAMAHTPRQEDTSPPSILAHPIATAVDDRIEIQWDASIDPDVVEYVLYRRTVADNARIEVDGLREVAYVDHAVEPGHVYAYSVAARDASGNLSAPSAEIQASVTIEAFLPVVSRMVVSPAILDTTATDETRRVRLCWSADGVDRCLGFAVDRSEDAGTTWTARTDSLLVGTGSFDFEEEISAGEYLYRIVAVSPRGYERIFDPIPVQWYDEGTLPSPTAVGEAFPNPSGGRFQLPLTLARTGSVRVTVYDLTGRVLRVLHDGTESAGPHAYAWDGDPAASGVYLLKVETSDRAFTRKVTVRK
jgi:chitodextrinase